LVANGKEHFLGLGKVLAGVVPIVDVSEVEGMLQDLLWRLPILCTQRWKRHRYQR
jgi:hypothetical protein